MVPRSMIEWYGYFSANFAHFEPVHQAPYMPTSCWADNWVLVAGIQNLVRGITAFGIALERIHFEQTKDHMFWENQADRDKLRFKEDGLVWRWIEDLGKELVAEFPPDERKPGIIYSAKTYKLK